jgi:DNA-directed RNA polymerase specialized sigma subunit
MKTKKEILEYVLKNKNIEAYIKTLTPDWEELRSDLVFQLMKGDEAKLLSVSNANYIEYFCFTICKRIKYGNIKDSEFFYKKPNIDELTYKHDIGDMEDTIDTNELTKLEEEINRLHWYDKTLFQMYYKSGYKYREISELTGINLKSIAHNINKTKKFLKNKFKEI